LNEAAELIQLEHKAAQQTSLTDILGMIDSVEDLLYQLRDEVEGLSRQVQRLRDDVDYLLSKMLKEASE